MRLQLTAAREGGSDQKPRMNMGASSPDVRFLSSNNRQPTHDDPHKRFSMGGVTVYAHNSPHDPSRRYQVSPLGFPPRGCQGSKTATFPWYGTVNPCSITVPQIGSVTCPVLPYHGSADSIGSSTTVVDLRPNTRGTGRALGIFLTPFVITDWISRVHLLRF